MGCGASSALAPDSQQGVIALELQGAAAGNLSQDVINRLLALERLAGSGVVVQRLDDPRTLAAGNLSQQDLINRLLALEQQRLDDQRAFSERLLQLLESRDGQRPSSDDGDARDRLVLAHSQARAAHPPGSELDSLLRRNDIVNTLTQEDAKQGSALEEAAADASDTELLSKGQLLLELSTRIDAATILTLTTDTAVNEVPAPVVSSLMASLLNSAASAAEYDRLSHRLVCIVTCASRLVIVLHRAAEQGKIDLSKDKDAVKQWRLALSDIRRLSRK